MSRLPQRVRQSTRKHPLTPAAVAAAGGLALAAVAIAIDRALAPPPDLFTVEAVQVFLSAVVGSTITVTALLFWIRGMLVQLAAGQLSNRVVRWYLEDHFMLGSIGYLVGVFTFTGVQLLALPSPEQGAAPPVGTALAMVLTVAALLSIVLAITNSVHATDTGMILHHLSDEARAAIRRRHPEDRTTAPREPTGGNAGREPSRVMLSAIAEGTGWVNEIDVQGLLDTMPEGSTLDVKVRIGSFVPEGQAMADLSTATGANEPGGLEQLGAALGRHFSVGRRRDATSDVEFSVSKLVDVALAAIAPHSAERTTAFEAIRHLGVVLRELYSRELPQTHHVREGDRQLVMRADLGYGDYLRRTFGQVREAAGGSLHALGTLLATLGDLRDELAAERRDDRHDAIDEEAARLIDVVRHASAGAEERRQVLELAARHGWQVPGREFDQDQADKEPPPGSPEDVIHGEPSEASQ